MKLFNIFKKKRKVVRHYSATKEGKAIFLASHPTYNPKDVKIKPYPARPVKTREQKLINIARSKNILKALKAR